MLGLIILIQQEMQMIRMKKEYCALCHGTGFYSEPLDTGGYRTKKCDHEWQREALIYKLNSARKRFEESKKDFVYLIQCQKHMEEV